MFATPHHLHLSATIVSSIISAACHPVPRAPSPPDCPTTAQSSLTRQALGPQSASALPLTRPPRDSCRTGFSCRDLTSHNAARRLVLQWASHLDAVSGYPCRTWLPSGARCRTTGTPAVRPARSSRTRASPTHPSMRPQRIETELSHDVLNPARVPLSSANSRTLGTDSSPRM